MSLEEIKNSLTFEINPSLSTNEKTKLASVLIVIFDESPKILMIKKPITMNHNGGEIAFPGGKISDEDVDLLDTAIRETKEETGVIVKREQVIGQLKPVTTLNSGFTILPFVCIFMFLILYIYLYNKAKVVTSDTTLELPITSQGNIVTI